MAEYIEPNRDDPEECDACYAIEDLCDFHLGVAVGSSYTTYLMGVAADNLEMVYDFARRNGMTQPPAWRSPLGTS